MPSAKNQGPKTQKPGLLIAVSGGLDSRVLLDVLVRLQNSRKPPLVLATKNFPQITAIAHFNHNFHKKAQAQARFVQDLAQQYNLPCYFGKAQTKLTSEADFRAARFQFLAKVAQQLKATQIALAHHGLDKAETFLLNLLRGTGLAGLASLPEFANFPGSLKSKIQLWRPFIKTPKTQIQAYAKKHQLKFVSDPTNTDLRFKRNFLRHTLWPLFRQMNSQATANILQAQDQITAAQAFLVQTAQHFLKQNPHSLPLAEFNPLPAILRGEILRQIYQTAIGHFDQVTAKNFQEILLLAQNPAGHKKKRFGKLEFRTAKLKARRVLVWRSSLPSR